MSQPIIRNPSLLVMNTDPKKDFLYSIYTLFFITFFFHLFFIFQGLDVTDTGFNLVNQVEAYNLHINSDRIYPHFFLSDFFGGMWLSIIHKPSIIWARIGGILLYSLNTIIVFSIISQYFERSRTFLIVFISSLFVTMRYGIDTINYNTFPAFLLTIELWLFHKALTKHNDVFGFLIGFMAVPIILSRISLVAIFICPVALFLYQILIKRKNMLRTLRFIMFSAFGFILSVSIMGFMYWYLGLLQHGPIDLFAGPIKELLNKESPHSLDSLYSLYTAHLKILSTASMNFIILTITLLTAGMLIRRSYARILFICIPLIFVVMDMSRLTGWEYELIAYRVIMAASGISFISACLFCILDKGTSNNLALLLIAGVSIMAITPLGSNRGLLNLCFGMWLIMPLSFLCIDHWLECTRNSPLSIVLTYNNSMLVVVMVLSLIFHFTNIYRDNPNRLTLTEAFSHQALAGIFSTPQRVSAVDDVLAAIGRYAMKNEEVLMANNLPLFYYLTETKPALDNAWLFLEPVDKIKQRQQKLLDENRLPRLLVLSKIDTRGEPKWPDTKSESCPTDTDKLSYIKHEYIHRLEYKLIWKTRPSQYT